MRTAMALSVLLLPALAAGQGAQLVNCESTSRAGLRALLGVRFPSKVAGGVACALAAPVEFEGGLATGSTLVVLTKKGAPYCSIVTFETSAGGRSIVSNSCPLG